MSDKQQPILVLGATGQQGGATVRHLRAAGWRVRALARDPGKPSALALLDQGVEVVRGDLDQPASLRAAMEGVHGVFSVQSFLEAGVAAEERRGKAVIDASRAAGVAHIVYSSVGGAERESGLAHFESKWQIERYLREHDLPATVLRPTFFMDNFPFIVAEGADQTLSISMALRPETALQMVAVDDIGAFAAMAFAQPARFLGHAIELAGDALTPAQIADVFQRVLGKPAHFTELPVEQLRSADPEMGNMFAWFNQAGYQADIVALRQLYPPLQTLEAWLRQSAASLFARYPSFA